MKQKQCWYWLIQRKEWLSSWSSDTGAVSSVSPKLVQARIADHCLGTQSGAVFSSMCDLSRHPETAAEDPWSWGVCCSWSLQDLEPAPGFYLGTWKPIPCIWGDSPVFIGNPLLPTPIPWTVPEHSGEWRRIVSSRLACTAEQAQGRPCLKIPKGKKMKGVLKMYHSGRKLV